MDTSFAVRQYVRWATLGVVLVVLLPTVSAAQQVVRSFDQIGTRISPGEEVRVTDDQGQHVRGRIVSVESTSLVLDARGERLRLRAEDVSQVRRYYKDSGWDGALFGAAAGVAGLLGLMYAGDPEMAADPEARPGLVVLGAGGGALVGFIIDKLHRGQRTVYIRPPAAGAGSVLSVVPVITSRAKAAVLVLSF